MICEIVDRARRQAAQRGLDPSKVFAHMNVIL